MVFIRRQPSDRDCALAQAALEALNAKEKRSSGIDAAQAPLIRRDPRRGFVRLIDLERRARFARIAS